MVGQPTQALNTRIRMEMSVRDESQGVHARSGQLTNIVLISPLNIIM